MKLGIMTGVKLTLPAVTLTRLQSQHQLIPILIQGLSANFIKKKHYPDKWSIHDNLAHLGRYQEVFHERIGSIQGASSPPEFERYVAEHDPNFAAWQIKEAQVLLSDMEAFRNVIYSDLAVLSHEALHQAGIHPKFGSMNVIEWTEFFLLHESHHIYTIFRLIREFS